MSESQPSAVSSDDLIVRLAPTVKSLPAGEWNALGGNRNPFVAHEFLTALEDSQSVGRGTGWEPAPIVLTNKAGKLLGALPSYAKGHSQGEYVFDHSWADAYQRAGGRYYPKLQIAAPFTPANGPRLLLRDRAFAPYLLAGAEQVCLKNALSSAHATFIEDSQRALFEDAGWMMRSDLQFHWINRGYRSFDEFLGQLSSRKRKNLRKEREVAREGLEIQRLNGSDLREEHWDVFWNFYQDTGARKWGSPYLTREAFSLLGERMGSRIYLLLALENGEPIAGALNFLGEDALYGRYWGCSRQKRYLHFELCYYQAIDIAIERGVARVEAGAQGPHKLARGYEPVQTWSAHWIADPSFRAAVAEFLEREQRGIREEQNFLAQRAPFRKD